MVVKRERDPTPSSFRQKRVMMNAFDSSSEDSGTDSEPELESRGFTSSTRSFSESGSCDNGATPKSLPQTFRSRESSLEAAGDTLQVPPDTPTIIQGLATPDTRREASYEGTTPSRQTSMVIRCPTPTSPDVYESTEAFPMFKNGNVTIKCELETPSKTWVLHSSILAQHSAWFARSLQSDSNYQADPTMKFSYKVTEDNNKIGFVKELCTVQPPTNGTIPNIEGASPDIKIEDSTNVNTSMAASLRPVTTESCTDTLHLCDQIFGLFYTKPLKLPTDNINKCLQIAEALVAIAQDLECLPLLQPSLNAALLQHGKALYKSILNDPARWLLISLSLQNLTIYTEALIHLIGAHPIWPKHWTTRRSALPSNIKQLIASKSRRLDQECIAVERKLILLTIDFNHTGPVQPHDKPAFETWFNVAVFRHYLSTAFQQLENNRESAVRRGKLYRQLRRGGSDYLAYAEMRRMISNIMPAAVDGLEEDLEILKTQASEVVGGVARNESMVDVEAEEVGWLTCVKVGRGDVPWLVAQESVEV